MKKKLFRNIVGVTLIEMLLVMVIVSSIIYMSIGYIQQRTLNVRLDRTAIQMQQILNAALSYYVANNAWPPNLAALQPSYLPGAGGVFPSPWNSNYGVVATSSNYYVYVRLPSAAGNTTTPAIANVLKNLLPLSYLANSVAATPPASIAACAGGAAACYVVTTINIPGQNLNNATAVNFAGLYHSGACVPQPTCPTDANGNTMTPQIMVVPVSVNGYNDAPGGAPCNASDLSGCSINAYPLSGFTAYATAATAVTAGSGPSSCDGTVPSAICAQDYTNAPITSGNYYRVCLAVTTEKGQVVPASNPWGQLVGVVMAITRCAPTNENPGSGFTVWSN